MRFSQVSAVVAALGVVLGAFGAHGLEKQLEATDRGATWDTAVLYHLVHAVVLWFLSWRREAVPVGPWWCFAGGIAIFSGSLYILCLSNVSLWGAVTPFGGVALIAGWVWLAVKPS